MLKMTAIVSLMLIVTWSQADSKRHKREATASEDIDPGSTLWAAGLSCDSCGSECASACGTRHFRSCCFNYLRRKRGPEVIQFWPQSSRNTKTDDQKGTHPNPMIVIENIREPWMSLPNLGASDIKPYSTEDTTEDKLQILYGA